MDADQLGAHRPALLRHCYRMLGSLADAEDVVQDVLVNAWNAREAYSGSVPVGHWLMRIATNTCLNELAKRKRRLLPHLERDAATSFELIEQLESAEWLTPAPDVALFTETYEVRESVALAFVALLQRLPPRQRAVLLLKDVVGWSAEEIADALETTASSVNSALHRARETIEIPRVQPPVQLPAALLHEYIRSWEERDIDALVKLLREDVVFAMPPHASWFRGPDVERLFRSDRMARFWSHKVRVVPTLANGQLAFAFWVATGQGYAPHSLQVVEVVGDQIAQVVQFIGPDYLRGVEPPSC
jgi:RNA polymerase sigma-70 factor (ECF subfamily)